ncbi:MAG TPA: pyridoxal phosphate-dependent aminotransferase [Gemmatimonadaceae bacterium]|jgi:aspartate aminotransferase|nr:pyridoxal phosphate-dependent aminotransferase [Gemmatimonadaceae bacterium]
MATGVDDCTRAAGGSRDARLPRRVVELGVEKAFEVLAAARRLEAAGRTVIHLEAGEPDFPTPPHIVEAGIQALRDGLTTYTQSSGIQPLRVAIAESMLERGVLAQSDNVVVTPGSKLALFHVLTALLEPGDEVLLPDPGYPAYAAVTTFAGGVSVPYIVDPDTGVDVDAIASRIGPRTRILVINSPHNPTGHALDEPALERLAELAERHDLMVLSDEIYRQLSFDGVPPVSIASLPGMAARTVIVDGFSKAYAMTGWRLGYGVMPIWLADAVGKLMNNSAACVAPFVQVAGIAALQGPQDAVHAMRDEFRLRRDLIVARLNTIPGVHCATPGGAFYVFPDMRAALKGATADGVADALLYERGVGCLAGTAFGDAGHGYLRFSYVRSRADLSTAMDRVEAEIRAL